MAKYFFTDESLSTLINEIKERFADKTSTLSHIGDTSNPHSVTLEQLGIVASTTELNQLSGITDNVQGLLNNKANAEHTHISVTNSNDGFMTSDMLNKLNNIAENANNYTLPVATTTLGGVKTDSSISSTNGLASCPIIGGVVYYEPVIWDSF